MQPDLVAAFCDAFIAEWNRIAAEMSSSAQVRQDALMAAERKISNPVDAVAEGSPGPA